MKTIITIALILCSIGVSAQSTDTSPYIISTAKPYVTTFAPKLDTVEVLAYCLLDYHTPIFQWLKAYAVYGWDLPSINFNGLIIYKKYLTIHGKEPFPFKVVYAINKP